jgi:SHS2 domain-containing protein
MTALGRSHAPIGHTADVGVRVRAPDPGALLEEAALALAEIGADVGPNLPATRESVSVAGDDLEGLAYAWLNELIGLADARGEALVRAEVIAFERAGSRWTARGVGSFAPFGADVRPRIGVKAATFHRLRVVQGPAGWTLEAYFDV